MDFPRDSFIKEINSARPEYKKAVLDYADNLLSKNLPVIFSLNHFAELFGIDINELRFMLNNIDGFYAYYLIKKKHGGKRRILSPYRNLKRIQEWILHEILDKVQVHQQCKGFVRGSNTLQNAKPHIGRQYIRKFDLKDFFESITVDRVYGIFHSIGYSPVVSHDLATICTLKLSDYKYNSMSCFQKKWFGYLYRKEKAVLAQGAPTSPALAKYSMS